jgi:hypothetical protein
MQLILGNVLQYGDGVVVKVLPTAGGKLLKDLLALLVPGPPQVFCKTPEFFKQFCGFIRIRQ